MHFPVLCSRAQPELRAERFRRSREAVNTEIAETRSGIQVLENDLMHNENRRRELAEQIANAEESSRSFDEGIKKTVDWYMNNKQWWEDIINGEYQNYYEKMYSNR